MDKQTMPVLLLRVFQENSFAQYLKEKHLGPLYWNCNIMKSLCKSGGKSFLFLPFKLKTVFRHLES